MIGQMVRQMRATMVKKVRSSLNASGRAIVPMMASLGRERLFDVTETIQTNDYVRLSSLELALSEINDRGVIGSLAEVGVYQGLFAAKMNAAMPNRTLYLFDTFNGFDASDDALDRAEHGLRHSRDFSDTSVDSVLGRMTSPARCVVRQGWFPETTSGLEDERFAFVSLDADLYAPTIAGLRFFYPRVTRGGSIFVHDYNNSNFPGARRAVVEFAKETGAPFTPLTDAYGTAVFAL